MSIIKSLIVFIVLYEIKVTKSTSDSCIVWQDLETVYKEYDVKLKEQNNNESDVPPKTADELLVDREAIKRVPTVKNESANTEAPVHIKMTFYIDDINSISDVDMHWEVFRNDCTNYKNSLKGRKVVLDNITEENKIAIGEEYFNLFWIPDIMIANAKSLKKQSEIIDTRLIMIYFDNDEQDPCHMEYLARFESTVSCPMNFEDAPIDTQVCYVQLRSFAFDEDKVILSWNATVEKNPATKLLEHELSINQRNGTVTLFNANYSYLEIRMQFDRKLANKMVGVYTPSILIVMITFCTFWLGLNSTSERVTIGITALLALVTQFNDVRQSLPPTSYITEIDKWMIMCMVFVSAQMIQCTLVDHVYHHMQHKQQLKQKAMNVIKQFRRNSESRRRQRLLVPDIKSNAFIPPDKINEYAKVFPRVNHRVVNNAFKRKPIAIKEEDSGCVLWLTHMFWSLTSVPTSPDKPEYLPMKIDAYSRIIFPLFFITICSFYWPIMLLKIF